MKYSTGFSFIEILIVLAVIAILSTLALPDKSAIIARTQINESIKLIDDYKIDIVSIYKNTGAFPESNEEASLPAPEKIKGNFVSQIDITDGSFHIMLGAKIRPALDGKIISIRPIYIEDSLGSPVSWVCGNDTVPDGMKASGENKTDVDATYLPLSCR